MSPILFLSVLYFVDLDFVNAIEETDLHFPPKGKCWGYEKNCEFKDSLSSQSIKCPNSDQEDVSKFFTEADFGYVQKRIKSMQTLCKPRPGSSRAPGFLQCSEQLQHCDGKNIMIDFSDLVERKSEYLRYKSDILKPGQIGGKCDFEASKLKSEMIHVGILQSWSAELQNFKSFESNEVMPCDVRIEKPTIIMKLDAAVNMYHHFCDFFNLYASLHINGSTNFSKNDKDVNILIWENMPYRSAFSDTFQAFTDNPLQNLNTYAGKRVCFKEVMFPLLPRMLWGLYYNTPLSHNECQNSALFKSFSDFITNRLQIKTPDIKKKLQVTVLVRKTKHRQILNLPSLHDALIDDGNYEVVIAPFTHNYPTFREQMQIIRNTDILVGIHGAGLTHLLFLPDWAVIFELYDCQDPNCYKDLARLRGVKHITWTDLDKLMPQKDNSSESEKIPEISAKFTNYAFDTREFLRKIKEGADHVANHPSYVKIMDSKMKPHDEL